MQACKSVVHASESVELIMLPAGTMVQHQQALEAPAAPCKLHRKWLDVFLSPMDVASPESACTSNSSRDGAELLPVHPRVHPSS